MGALRASWAWGQKMTYLALIHAAFARLAPGLLSALGLSALGYAVLFLVPLLARLGAA